MRIKRERETERDTKFGNVKNDVGLLNRCEVLVCVTWCDKCKSNAVLAESSPNGNLSIAE